jgi:hypothetical protein
MVTDPPYGVGYDPAWRNAAGAAATRRTVKVLNDDRADWREAWALFPGEVAYVWHGGLHAATVAESLEASGYEVRSQIIWAKERLVISRGHYHQLGHPDLVHVPPPRNLLNVNPIIQASCFATGGVPWVWKDSIVFKPQAWPFFRSASVQTTGFQSGARMSRAPELASSIRLPAGSHT